MTDTTADTATGTSAYATAHQQSITDPDAFWLAAARDIFVEMVGGKVDPAKGIVIEP